MDDGSLWEKKKRKKKKEKKEEVYIWKYIYTAWNMCVMCVRDKYISSNLVDSYLSGILRIIYIYIFDNSYDNFRYIWNEKWNEIELKTCLLDEN